MTDAAARLHRGTSGRGGVAGGGERAAGGEAARHRLPREHAGDGKPTGRRLYAALARGRVDRRSKHHDRVPLVGRAQRALRRHPRRVYPPQGRSHRHTRDRGSSGCQTRNIGDPDPRRSCWGPGRHRSGRQSVPPGRQHHRTVRRLAKSCLQTRRTFSRGGRWFPPHGDPVQRE
jgi:hypothetical protein